MVFQEPKMEFVRYELADIATTSGWCAYGAASTQPSTENCTGPEAPMNDCPKYNAPDMIDPNNPICGAD